tara:strand:- start:1640 stop:1912 length:273 start_codon:yes stop_codon:yes gene_type:complete
MREDIKTVYLAMGEHCDLSIVGLMIPHLAAIYPDHTLTINTQTHFSSKNGCGEAIVVCWVGNEEEYTVYNIIDFLYSEAECEMREGATVH